MATDETDPLVAFCRSLPGATEDIKWDNDLVFSVGGKMFAAFGLPELQSIGCKVEPAAFDVLTRQPGIIPAPYLARAFWISLKREALPQEAIEDLLRESHALVAAKLSKKVRKSLEIGEPT
ncbi:MAG TPA: MmcQ/YjbR family DNA-binding protein [Thermoanaerobaculia bacterium]|nr:MmcQ/YjbR family DNA-binding protein [Thermoanaerobaculia bacterium]